MEVILREDVPQLGIIGEIVNVAPGYARNFLFPRGIAVPADRRNRRRLDHEQQIIEIKKERERGTYERMANDLAKVSLEIEVRAGRGGKLFGSVTNIDLHRLLEEAGFDIDRRRIQLGDPIKAIGNHGFAIQVGQDVMANLNLLVKPIGGELEDESVDGDDRPEPMPEPFETAAGEEGESEEAAAGEEAEAEGDDDVQAEESTES
ncbi:MAG: large subunit ribosomal protein L9 [Hyphomicrobiaceae bacterium]|jgi:large subunit ribosomal protein L9